MMTPITLAKLQKELKELKQNKSPGKDGITNEMINHLGKKAIKTLLGTFNAS